VRPPPAQRSGKKYSEIEQFCFIPNSAETLGPWGPKAINVLNELGDKLIATSNKDKRAKLFLLQQLSKAVVRGNSASVLNTHLSFRASLNLKKELTGTYVYK
jgi:hypothetical protein